MKLKFYSILTLFVCSTTFLFATDYYVDDNSNTGDIYTIGSAPGSDASADGTNPLTPFASLGHALTVVSPGDRIFVDAGNFLGERSLNININNLSIIGAGPLLTVFDNNRSGNDFDMFGTVSGDGILLQGFKITAYTHAFGATALVINNLTNGIINNVLADNNIPGGGDAAIVITNSQVDFTGGGSNCNTLAKSVAGGGVNIEGPNNTITFTNYSFSSNNKDLQGGSGLYIVGDNTSSVTITDAIFADNINGGANGGSALYTAGGAVVSISNSLFKDNVTTFVGAGGCYGGAVTVGRSGDLTLTNCSYVDNVAQGGSGRGGAIGANTQLAGINGGATININTCSFSGNTADGGTGNDIYARVGSGHAITVNINNCTFSRGASNIFNGNTATINLQDSDDPATTGPLTSGTVTIINTNLPSGLPAVNPPVLVGDCYPPAPCTNPDPTGLGTASFCSSVNATVSDLVANVGTGTLVWYNQAVGGVAYNGTETLIDGQSYFASNDAAGCSPSVNRLEVVVTIIDPAAPTSNGDIEECEESPIQTLDANDALASLVGVSWFDAAVAGNPVATPTQNTIGSSTYFAEFTDGTCTSLTRTSVTLTINDSPNPPASSGNIAECEENPIQTLDANDALASLVGVSWFDAAIAGNPVATPTQNTIGGTTYFAEFNDGTCTSLTRTAVLLTINDSPDAPVSSGNIAECEENPIQTLDANDALASFVGVSWFDAAVAGNPVATPTQNTIGSSTYFAEFTDGTCTSLTRTSVTLTINDSPNPPASSGNIAECEENPIQTLDANDALASTVGITWFDAATAGNPVATPTQNTIGSTTYFAEFNDGTCTSLTRTSVLLTINDSPDAPASSGDISECEQNPIQTLDANDALGSTVGVSWFDAATGGNPVVTPTQNTIGSTPYYAEFNDGTCPSLTRTEVVLTINDSPNPPASSGDISECPENPLQTLDANDALASSIGVTWYDAATAGNVVANPTLNALTTETYFAEFNDGTCTSLTRSQVILTIAASLPPPFSNGPITECTESPIQTLDANDALNGSNGVTWFDADTGGNVVATPTTNALGSVSYFAEFSDGTCTSLTRTEVVLTLNASPAAPVSLGDIEECEIIPLQTLDANDALSSTNGITWYDAATAGNTVASPTQNALGSVSYFAEFSDGTCSSLTRTEVILTLNDAPDAPINNGDLTECTLNPIQTLDANDALASTAGVTWYDAAIAGNIVATPTLSSVNTISYFAEFNNGVCASIPRTEVVLTLNASPAAPTSNGDITECELNPIQTLDAKDALTSTNGVTWYDAAALGNLVATPTLNSLGSVSYFAEFSDGTCNSLTRTEVDLTLNDAPDAPINNADLTECSLNPIQTLDANDALASTIGVIWYDAPLNGNIVANPTLNTVSSISYFAELNNGVCSSIPRTEVVLTINASPDSPTNNGDIAECETSPLQTLNANSALTNSVGITWFNAATNGNVVASPSLNAVSSITYFAEFNDGACTSLTRTPVMLTINPAPSSPTGDGNQGFCIEDNALVSDLQVVGTSIQWYSAAIGGAVINPTVSLVNGGSYYASQTVAGCESIDRLPVIVAINQVTLSQVSVIQPICGQQEGEIEVLASGGEQAYTYTWNNGTTGEKISFISSGNYTVSVIDNNGCVASLDVTLDCVIGDIPEIITPGGNGKNDTWILNYSTIFPDMTVSIFNRWGNEVFKASPYLDDWDGKANTGVMVGTGYLPNGTYYYIIDLGNGKKPQSGYIELVR